MANTILLKRSSTASSTPTAGQLSAGELAINTLDEKIFFKNSAGTVKSLSAMSDLTSNLVTISTTQTISGSKTFSVDVTMTGDLAVNGGDITTTAATATLFNANATTVTAFGAATTLTLAALTTAHTVNIATGGLPGGSTKTINIGTGSGNATRTSNVNIGSIGGKTYFNSGEGVFVGDNSGLTPGVLYVDTVVPYTDLGSLSLISYGGNMSLTSSASIFVGDDGTANSTGITINDIFLSIGMYAGSGVTLSDRTELRFAESAINGANYVGFKAPASLSANKIWVLPSADGSANQVLKTDGAGNLGWATAGGGSAAGSDTQVQFNDGGTAFGGDSGLTYNKTTDTLSVGTSSSAGYLNVNGQGELRLNDADSSNYVALKSPATVSSNVTWTMPSADGAGGQVLTTNGSGTLSWSTPTAVELALFNMGII